MKNFYLCLFFVFALSISVVVCTVNQSKSNNLLPESLNPENNNQYINNTENKKNNSETKETTVHKNRKSKISKEDESSKEVKSDFDYDLYMKVKQQTKDNKDKKKKIKEKSLKTVTNSNKLMSQSPILDEIDRIKSSNKTQIEANCFFKLNEGNSSLIYNINPIKEIEEELYEDLKVKINLCNNVQYSNCTKSGMVLNNECVKFSDTSSKDKLWVKEKDSFNAYFPQGEECPYARKSEPEDYIVKVSVKCDKSINETIVKYTYGFTSCNPRVTLISNLLCDGTEYKTWIEKLGIQKDIIAFIFITLGLIIIVLGNKLKFALYFCMTIICSGLLFIIVLSQFETLTLLNAFLISLALGAIVAYLIQLLADFLMVVAVLSGITVGTILFSSLQVAFTSNNIAVFVIVLILSVMVFVQFKFKFENFFVIVASAITGSIIAIRGVGILNNTFPDEVYLYKLMHHDENSQFKKEMTKTLELNILPFALLVVIGLIIQSSIKSYSSDDEKDIKSDDNKEKTKEASSDAKVNIEEPKVNNKEHQVKSEEPKVKYDEVVNKEEPKVQENEEPKRNDDESNVNNEEEQ